MSVQRKRKHVDVCLSERVEFQTRSTGFERWDLPYRALPETDLAHIDTRTTFLGKPLAAPLLIGAMTGGGELSERINRNLAEAAERTGIGMMLGSQRVMLERPETRSSFEVRRYAPSILLIGNFGVAQLNHGYGARELRAAVDQVGADALALHANPLQEALQAGGDTDFRNLVTRLHHVVPEVGAPVLLKEVGHGLSVPVAQAVAGAGLSALDVAGAGGTSWARVEEYVNHGEVRNLDLAEWGIPTADALRDIHEALPAMPLVASGGIRTGLDIAKAVAMGAQVCAVAKPLLRPATQSADAVVEHLEALIWGLRVAMHGSGCPNLDALAATRAVPRPGLMERTTL